MNEEIHIALACDERYFPGLLATITSILVSSDSGHAYRFHVLDGGIKSESLKFLKDTLSKFKHDTELNVIGVDTSQFDDFPEFFFDSPMNYARLLLPKLLKNLDKAIYTDVDILHFKDIKNLWSENLPNYSMTVGMEVSIKSLGGEFFDYAALDLSKDAPYFNNGLMMMDLNKWRSENISEKVMNFISNHPDQCEFHEQSAMNIILSGDFKLLDKSWNVQSHREAFDQIEDFNQLKNFEINFHFVTSSKPWLKYNDSPQNRLFYTLLDELGYTLTNPDFISSKQKYKTKMKVAKYLPSFYRFRSITKKILGKNEGARSDKKTADFWKEQLPVLRFRDRKKESINQMIGEWRANISDTLEN
ncbi:MAG TPA: glycosyltransferase [Balneolaceae bacterium]|nr:glycosyltransferase [Balneolaceae bacterium]